MERLFAALRSIFYVSGFVLLWSWLALAVRPLDGRLPFTVSPALRPLGVLLALPGIALAAWSIVTFITRGRGTPAVFDPPREFVAVGPYRFVRNPMYVGGLAAMLGAGLLLRSPSILLLAAAFALALHVFVLAYEEPALRRRFGPSYVRYQAAVNRWLPRGSARPGG